MKFLSLLFIPILAWAELDLPKFRFSPAAFEKRYESTTDPILTGREPRHVSLGIIFDRHFFSLEYSTFRDTTGNGTFRVDRKFQDLLLWYRYTLFQKRKLRGTGGAGLGIYQEDIVTGFYNTREGTASGTKWSAGAVAGLEYELLEEVVVALEGRLLAGQNFDPNPQPSVMTRMYFQF